MVNGKHAVDCSLWTTTAGYYHCSSSAKSALVFLFSLFSSWKKLQRFGSGNNLQESSLTKFCMFSIHFFSFWKPSAKVRVCLGVHKSQVSHFALFVQTCEACDQNEKSAERKAAKSACRIGWKVFYWDFPPPLFEWTHTRPQALSSLPLDKKNLVAIQECESAL